MAPSPQHGLKQKLAALGLVCAYSVYFSLFTCATHDLLLTHAYDLGTFDQGVWLAGRPSDLFVTVRGLHLLGDHARFISFFLAPLYWIWDDVRALLTLQSVSIAVGGYAVFRIAERTISANSWVGVGLCACYLLHPAVQNLNLDYAHPDAFASTFILFSLLFLRTHRYGLFAGCAALAMSCKEDIAPAYVVVGLILASRKESRRFGLTLFSIAGVWFLLSVFVILPYFNGVGFFRFDGGRPLAGLGSRWADVEWLIGRVLGLESSGYLFRLGAPLLFIFLLSPRWLLPAIPSIGLNVLSDVHYFRSFDFHYQAVVMPFIFVATIDGLAYLQQRSARATPGTVQFATAAVLVAGTFSNLQLARLPITDWERLNQHRSLARRTDYRRIHRQLQDIPRDAVVSADFSLVPQLSHRHQIYMFPNPFEVHEWGARGENSADPSTVEYVVFRRAIVKDNLPSIVMHAIANGQFHLINDDRALMIYKRTAVTR